MQETIGLKGHVKIYKNDVLVVDKANLIVQVGKNFLANAMLAASASPFTHLAIGSGAAAPASSDTTLQTELARLAFTSSGVAANVVNLSATFPAGTGTGTIQEAGFLNNAAGGTLFSRVTFTAIPKLATDSLVVTWAVTVG